MPFPGHDVQLGDPVRPDLTETLYRRMKKTLLECAVIHADETVVQVLKEDGKAATSESRMWVYANNDRSGKHAAAFLKDFSGCLVTDGYAGYNQVDGVIRCGCWRHMRRYWREAMPKGADSSAIVYSIVETAKANGLDPYTYLKLLLTELPYLGKNLASGKLDLFMPWTAAIHKNCILPTKKISPEDL